jgi:hypothetical protein
MTGSSIIDAAELLGEEKKMLLALVILALVTIAIGLVQWAIDRVGAARVLRWLVLLAICLAAFVGALHAMNLL